MAAYVPPGWPPGVHPPGSEDFERTAQAWLLDVVPADYRLHGVLRRYPLALAAMAAHHAQACVAGAREGYRNARTEVGGALPPHALEALLAAYRAEGRRLVATAQAVDLVARALRGEVFTPQLQDAAQPGGQRIPASAGAEGPPGRPTAERSAAERPAAERSAAQRPAAQRPAPDRPAARQPAPGRPAPGQPDAEHPTAEHPTAGQQAAGQQAAGQQVTGRPPAERSADERPAREQPAREQPTAEQAAAQRPPAQRPARDGTGKGRKTQAAQRPARHGGATTRKVKQDQHASAS
jgi:hypothetical protein